MSLTTESINATRDALAKPMPVGMLNKAFTQPGSATSGLAWYDLEGPAKSLYPVITPIRNTLPRVVATGGTQANWRAVTGVNVGNATFGVSEGNRGPVLVTSTQDYFAVFRGYGFDDYATFEAGYAAQGFDDIQARTVTGLIQALMIQEEKIVIGANTSLALGTTPTPSLTTAASGGSIASGTQSVICVALSYEGFLASSVASGLPLSGARNLADGSTEQVNQGTAKQSTAATIATTGSSSTVTASVAPVRGAFGYAWFLGAAGSEKLAAITATASVTLTAPAAAGAQAASAGFSADNSRNGLIFDGLFSQILTPGSGAYVDIMANGTTLTADDTGGVVEIDAALQSFWDNYRLSPDTIWVSSQEQRNITTKVLAGSVNAAQRFVINVDQGQVKGGDLVTSYLNKFSMDGAKAIPVRLHPNMPPGTILFTTSQIPYPLSNVGNVLQMCMRQDFFAIEWPRRTRKWEYGVYADGVLQNYFPPAFGLITNIANG
ncbi:MAG TPA: hypothetical protein VL574_01290 [Stellaceae bacterium]|nr:hypothetical protein [Stellaceae bacterium]